MAIRVCGAGAMVVALLATTWMSVAFDARRGGRAASPSQTSPAPAAPGFVGTSSCSARACHGGIEPVAGQPVLQNEYVTWVTKDKHARAYEVLFDERSKRIAENLGAASGRVIPAHDDARCLACHSIPSLAVATDSLAALRQDGVGCEACHGPARDWLAEHTTRAWRDKSAAEKHARGMMPTDELATRAQLCAGCHIGAPADESRGVPTRNAHHDIMAAGHPRLSFEFGAFLANLPRHWIEHDQREEFEVRAWAIGQVASARAALEQLRARATTPAAPWPEFAEYDCFACHHDLREPSWQQRRGYRNRPPGALPWGDWYLSMTRALAEQSPKANRELLAPIEQLEKLMTKASPDRKAAADQASQIAKSLGDWLDRIAAQQHDRKTVRQALMSLAQTGPQRAESSWDSSAQLYLALVALNQAYGDDKVRGNLQEIFETLKFPPGYESPKGFQPDAFRAEIERLREHLSK